MPNWCYNSITISHKDPAMIERFKKAAESGILQEFIPCPQELLEGDGWYNWCVENWGTKWDVTCEDVMVREDTLSTTFNSAWSPPIEAYNKLQELGFVIDAYYSESGK